MVPALRASAESVRMFQLLTRPQTATGSRGELVVDSARFNEIDRRVVRFGRRNAVAPGAMLQKPELRSQKAVSRDVAPTSPQNYQPRSPSDSLAVRLPCVYRGKVVE